MIDIIYTLADEALAKTIHDDLLTSTLTADRKLTIALLSAAALDDPVMMRQVKELRMVQRAFAPVMIERIDLPDKLNQHLMLDLSAGYDKEQLLQFLHRVHEHPDQRRNNQRLFFAVGALVLLMFIISLFAISSGVVQFPVDEYATENAARDAQVQTLVAPNLEGLRPRNTQDALNFEITVTAMDNDKLMPFLVGTATAIPIQIHATNDARSTQIVGTEAAQTQAAQD